MVARYICVSASGLPCLVHDAPVEVGLMGFARVCWSSVQGIDHIGACGRKNVSGR